MIIQQISMSSILSDAWFAVIIGSFLIVRDVVTNRMLSRKVLVLIVLWVLINFIAVIFSGGYNFEAVYPRVVRGIFAFIVMPYYSIKLIGSTFWDKFEKVVYILTLISIPIFIINYFFFGEFNSLKYIFHPITREGFLIFNSDRPYWSALIYVNAVEDPFVIRNCGFMWEPGAFAMMIIWGLVYNFMKEGQDNKKKVIVYVIALITTFSTAGYLAFAVIFIAFYIKRLSIGNIFVLVIGIFVFTTYIYQLDFISGKLENYQKTYESGKMQYNSSYEIIKVNRFQAFAYSFIEVLKFPLGKGRVLDEDFTTIPRIFGTNGIGALLTMYGIIIFPLIIYYIKKYIDVIEIRKTGVKDKFLLFIALLMVFFSNPIEKNMFIYLILLTPMVFAKSIASNES